MERSLIEIVTDPQWFPMRFAIDRDSYQFVWLAPEMHRAITFLNDVRPQRDDIRMVPSSTVAKIPTTEAPLHMILHSGLGGSTLLARALAQPGVVTTLKEPPILTDVIASGLQGVAPDNQRLFLNEVARLLARPFASGEAIVLKMSSIGNGLVSAIARDRPQSQILCLQTPLELMLASLVSRGNEGRLGARRLFTGMRNSKMIKVEPAGDRSDLELAALAWLSIQKMMLDAAEILGSARVRSVTGEAMIAEPRKALASISGHFRLSLDVDGRLGSGIFSRHSKTGQPFDAQSRAHNLQATLREHGREIEGVVDWARRAADANAIAWDPPYPLF